MKPLESISVPYSVSMNFKLLSLLLLIFSFNISSAQNNKLSKEAVTNQYHQDYLENTVVFKLKHQYKKKLQSSRSTEDFLKQLLPEVSVLKYKNFGSTIPKPFRKSSNEVPDVDISLIYVLEFDGDESVHSVINNLYKSGKVEYAEPKFIDKVFYTPNDPEAAPGNGKQWALQRTQAYEAWDITKGDTNMVIGIVDTDMNLDHPELINKIKYNYNDPVNGTDDDGDSFIDNFYGWDISENDNDPRARKVAVPRKEVNASGEETIIVDTLNGNGHATLVAGCAGAETDNNIGVAGMGYNSKILPVKVMSDVNAAKGSISDGYEGLLYAAMMGCQVVNLSWGGGGSYSQARQDIINHVVSNYDVVIVAAAGNDSLDHSFYPASYNNVLSVAASDRKTSTVSNKEIDIKWANASYGNDVDICAPGSQIYTLIKNDYGYNNGSSFAAPYVAGAAALVRTKFPTYNALQVQEQLRITADVIDTINENLLLKEKLGKGRLNIYKALTDTTSPSIRMRNNTFPNNLTTFAFNGDTIRFSGTYVNYLASANNLNIEITSDSPYIRFLDSTSTLSTIKTLDSADNFLDPFVMVISNYIPPNTEVSFRLGFSSGSYKDYQHFKKTVNPSYITIDTNQIAVTLTSKGRVGYNDSDNLQGIGLIYKQFSLLFEGGLMVSDHPSRVSDCVRSYPAGNTDFDFQLTTSIHKERSPLSDIETITSFIDSNRNKVGVEIIQKSYSWSLPPDDKYIMLSYDIKNTSGVDIDTLRVGIFADWDIYSDQSMVQESYNKASFDSQTKTGYVYNVHPEGLFAGVTLLSDYEPVCYSLDHASNPDTNVINPNDGFTTLEKYNTLSNGIKYYLAEPGTLGGDVSQVVGAIVPKLRNGEVTNISFALLAGDNKEDLISSARYAQQKYYTLKNVVSNFDLTEITTEFSIFPNPTRDIIKSITTAKEDLTITLKDLAGKDIQTIYLKSETPLHMDLSAIPSGLYLLKMEGQTINELKKIIKN